MVERSKLNNISLEAKGERAEREIKDLRNWYALSSNLTFDKHKNTR